MNRFTVLVIVAMLLAARAHAEPLDLNQITIASNGTIDAPIVTPLPGMPIDGYTIDISTSISHNQ